MGRARRLLDEGEEHLPDALVPRRRRPRHLSVGVAEDLLLPVQEQRPVLAGDADDVGDDRGGKWSGEGVEDLHPPSGGEAVDQQGGGGADVVLQEGDRSRREPAVDDPPVAGVERRIDVL